MHSPGGDTEIKQTNIVSFLIASWCGRFQPTVGSAILGQMFLDCVPEIAEQATESTAVGGDPPQCLLQLLRPDSCLSPCPRFSQWRALRWKCNSHELVHPLSWVAQYFSYSSGKATRTDCDGNWDWVGSVIKDTKDSIQLGIRISHRLLCAKGEAEEQEPALCDKLGCGCWRLGRRSRQRWEGKWPQWGQHSKDPCGPRWLRKQAKAQPCRAQWWLSFVLWLRVNFVTASSM